MVSESFELTVGGIEDGINQALSDTLSVSNGGYLKEIASYGGQLDEQTLKAFVTQLAPRFPLILVAYGDGEDKEVPATSTAFNEPRIFRHDCSFSVICCTNDARGEQAQRRGAVGGVGVYRMLASVRETLSGYRFQKQNGINQMVLLNLEPLKPSGVQYLARLPGLTAYAQHFDTYFKWTEPDRRVAGVPVQDLIIEVEPLNAENDIGGLPGVTIE
jgi:phage gp37-like protein